MWHLQLTLAFRYLWGRKLRSFLTTLAILFGTLVIFSTNLLLPTMVKSFQTNLLAASGQVDVTITLKTGEAFSQKELNKVKRLAGIRAIAESLSRTINIPENFYAQGNITAVTLTGIDPRAAQTLRNYPLKEGRFLRPDDVRAAVITTSLAKSLELKVDDKLFLPTVEGGVKLRVVGLLPERAMPGNEEVLVTLAEAQKLLDLSNRINTIEINLDTTDDAQRQLIINEIVSAMGDDYTLGSLSSGSEILAGIQMGQIMFNLFGFLAMFMGAFIIFNTFRTIIAERRHDIGMLRAIGASRSTIIGIILAEGLLQGIVGSLLGIGLGYLGATGLLILMSPLMNSFLHVEMGLPVIEPLLIFITLALGIGMTLLAGLLPALNASRVTPLEALRPSMIEVIQRTVTTATVIGAIMIALAVIALFTGEMSMLALGSLLLLTGLVLVASALVKPIATLFSRLLARLIARDGTGTLAQSNISRQPTRAAITASATMIGIAIIVGLGGMVISMTGSFLNVVRRSLGSDYLIMPPSVGLWNSNIGAKKGLAEELNAIHGVGVVSTLRFAAATANGNALSLLGIDPQAYPKIASLTFNQGDPTTAYAELEDGRTMISNGVLAAQLGIKTGDSVELSTPTGRKSYRIVAVAGDYFNAKIMTAYISQDNLQTDFRKSEDIFFQLNLEPDADAVMVESKINKILKDYPQFKLVSGKSYFEETKELFNAVYAVYFMLLGILAVPSLIALLNTLSIGVIERTREIGMLRAIGATQKQIRRIVTAEALLLAAIGTAFGLLAGLYLGYLMVIGMSTGGFPVSYTFPYAGLIAAVATGLVFGAIAAVLPANQAARMEIVRALRYE